MTLILDRILESAERASPRAAIITEGRVVTYRQLLALVSNAARAFHDRGVRPAEVVGLSMGESALYLVAFLALARIGAVTLPQYPSAGSDERVRALRRFGARWVVADIPAPASHDIPVIVMRGLHARGDERGFGFTGFSAHADSPLRIALTSGTVGNQKGLLHTHGSFAKRMERRFAAQSDAPRAIPGPLHITSALQVACYALAAGGTVVFPPSRDASALLSAIHLHAVTHVKLPPADLAGILALLPEETPAFPSIRELMIVGATPPASLVRLVRRKFSPHVRVSYSMTEVGIIAAASGDEVERMAGSSGRVVPGARLEVIGEDGRVVGPGERGEFRVAADGMPQDYHGPDAGLPGFRDGWFHPGDYGHVSEEGFVYVEGRKDNLMNVGGYKVAPEFVESVLCAHPGVAEAVAFAMPDDLAGMRVAAAVVGSVNWDRLRAYAEGALGGSAPSCYFGVAALPRNEMGKIARSGIEAWVASRGERIKSG